MKFQKVYAIHFMHQFSWLENSDWKIAPHRYRIKPKIILLRWLNIRPFGPSKLQIWLIVLYQCQLQKNGIEDWSTYWNWNRKVIKTLDWPSLHPFFALIVFVACSIVVLACNEHLVWALSEDGMCWKMRFVIKFPTFYFSFLAECWEEIWTKLISYNILKNILHNISYFLKLWNKNFLIQIFD